MKQRLKNKITSSFGIALLGLAIIFFITDKLGKVDFSLWEMAAVALLGWVFLWSKDTLLEGITMGIFKIKEK